MWFTESNTFLVRFGIATIGTGPRPPESPSIPEAVTMQPTFTG